jgi:hypothetical protein
MPERIQSLEETEQRNATHLAFFINKERSKPGNKNSLLRQTGERRKKIYGLRF